MLDIVQIYYRWMALMAATQNLFLISCDNTQTPLFNYIETWFETPLK